MFVLAVSVLVALIGVLAGLSVRAALRIPAEQPGPAPAPPAAPPPVFALEGLCKDYEGPTGTLTVLRDVNARIGRGITAILGASGEGKTTLLNIMGALMGPSHGRVLFLGWAIAFDDEGELRRYRSRCVSWVFQELNLIGHLNVVENAALPLLCQGWKRPQALEAARGFIAGLGLAGREQHYPHQLSRGQKQRVAIARAFASDARVILADEPTGSLDPHTAESVLAAFRSLSEKTGKPVVLVTHDRRLALRYADRILRCKDGRLRQLWRRGKEGQRAERGSPNRG